MDVGSIVPGLGQVFGARHATEQADVKPHAPVAEIGDRHAGALTDAERVFENLARIARCLERL
jgi:hypothetical protein